MLASSSSRPTTTIPDGRLVDQPLGGGAGLGFLELDIEDEHIGSIVPGHRDRVVGRADLRDHLHVVLAVEDAADPETSEGPGFDDDDPDHVVDQASLRLWSSHWCVS